MSNSVLLTNKWKSTTVMTKQHLGKHKQTWLRKAKHKCNEYEVTIAL